MSKYSVSTKIIVPRHGLTVKCFSQAHSCVADLVLTGVLFPQELETLEGDVLGESRSFTGMSCSCPIPFAPCFLTSMK